MRWERLFADLESQLDDDALAERDALIEDLREGEWAATSWRQLCGGRVVIEVAGLGRIEGEVVSANDQIAHLVTSRAEVVVSTAHVLAVTASTRRPEAPTSVTGRFGLGHALRMCQRDGDRVTVHRIDGSTLTGVVDRVGKDFVSIRDDSGASVVLPLPVIAAFSCPL